MEKGREGKSREVERREERRGGRKGRGDERRKKVQVRLSIFDSFIKFHVNLLLTFFDFGINFVPNMRLTSLIILCNNMRNYFYSFTPSIIYHSAPICSTLL